MCGLRPPNILEFRNLLQSLWLTFGATTMKADTFVAQTNFEDPVLKFSEHKTSAVSQMRQTSETTGNENQQEIILRLCVSCIETLTNGGHIFFFKLYPYVFLHPKNKSHHGFRGSPGSLGGVDCEGIDGRCLGRSVPPGSAIEKAKQKSSPLKFRKSSNTSYSNTYLKLFLTHFWEQSSNFNCFCRVYMLTFFPSI